MISSRAAVGLGVCVCWGGGGSVGREGKEVWYVERWQKTNCVIDLYHLMQRNNAIIL